MKYLERRVEGYPETIRQLFEDASKYKMDMAPFVSLSASSLFRTVADLPYVKDPKHKEALHRPMYTMDPDWKGPRDCDDKTLSVSAWCELRGAPYRIVVCGKEKDPLSGQYFAHHVYPELLNGKGQWIPFDVTFPKNQIGKRLYTLGGEYEPYREIWWKEEHGNM